MCLPNEMRAYHPASAYDDGAQDTAEQSMREYAGSLGVSPQAHAFALLSPLAFCSRADCLFL